MEPELQALIQEDVPKLNPLLAEGYSTRVMEGAVEWVQSIFQCAQNGFPEGFRYEGFKIASPEEQYREMTRRRGQSNGTYEAADNYLFLVTFFFSFTCDGETREYRKNIFLPYLKDANLFKLRGSTYMVSPVLVDNGFSVGERDIYVAPQLVKFIFNQESYNYKENGRSRAAVVCYSNFYNKTIKTSDKKSQANPLLMHYLLCRFGLQETFRRYAGIDIVAVLPEPNHELYPEDTYATFSSNGIEPRRWMHMFSKQWRKPNFALVLRREDASKKCVAPMVCGLFYILDHFQEHLSLDYFKNVEEETLFWMDALSLIHHPEEPNRGKRSIMTEAHLRSTDIYLDEMKAKELAREGLDVKDTYDLFYVMITEMTAIMAGRSQDIGSMYGKRLQVLQYMLRGIKDMIFNFMYVLQRTKKLNHATVEATLNNNKTGLRSYEANKILPNNKHQEMESAAYSGDNKAFKITNSVVQQRRATTVKSNDLNPNDPENHLHSSIAEGGNLLACPPADPTGRSKLNLYQKIDPDGFLLRDPRFIAVVDDAQEKIRRR